MTDLRERIAAACRPQVGDTGISGAPEMVDRVLAATLADRPDIATLVARLRERKPPMWHYSAIAHEAADALVALSTENERLKDQRAELQVDNARLTAALAAANTVAYIVNIEHTCEGCENDQACELGEALNEWHHLTQTGDDPT